jgi:hypothetical protein
MSPAKLTLPRYPRVVKFDEVLRRFSAFFEAEGIRYALAGGLAVHAWGHSRFTHDIDFAVDGAYRARILEFTESVGYRTLHVSPGYSNHEHPDEDFGILDLLYVYDDTADRIFTEASPRFVAGDVHAPVIKPEHLIAMKVQAIKNAPRRVSIDVPDIEFLLKLPGTDTKTVRDYFERAGLLRIYDVITRDA